MILLIGLSQIQTIAIGASILFLLLILFLIHRKRIKEEYSLLWIFVAIVFIVFSIWRDGLDYLANLMGVSYPPAALFLILLIAVFLILIEFSIIISKLSDKNKTVVQEIGILKQELKKLQEEDKEIKEDHTEDKSEYTDK